MNLVFIYLGEECLVIIYSASELAMGIFDVILQPVSKYINFSKILIIETIKKHEEDVRSYTQSLIQAPHISNTFETGQNLGKIKQSTGVFKKKIEKISNNSNTSKQR